MQLLQLLEDLYKEPDQLHADRLMDFIIKNSHTEDTRAVMADVVKHNPDPFLVSCLNAMNTSTPVVCTIVLNDSSHELRVSWNTTVAEILASIETRYNLVACAREGDAVGIDPQTLVGTLQQRVLYVCLIVKIKIKSAIPGYGRRTVLVPSKCHAEELSKILTRHKSALATANGRLVRGQIGSEETLYMVNVWDISVADLNNRGIKAWFQVHSMMKVEFLEDMMRQDPNLPQLYQKAFRLAIWGEAIPRGTLFGKYLNYCTFHVVPINA
jgi:sulfur carrier protein ThiS